MSDDDLIPYLGRKVLVSFNDASRGVEFTLTATLEKWPGARFAVSAHGGGGSSYAIFSSARVTWIAPADPPGGPPLLVIVP
jgi:hypothetical protein